MFFPFFPVGLGAVYSWVVVWICNLITSNRSDIAVQNWVELPMLGVAYVTYAVHLVLTSRAKTMRVFLLLMFSLVLLVSANLVGCAKQEAVEPPFQS